MLLTTYHSSISTNSMQSTGHGSMQSSHPVHKHRITYA